MLGHLLLAAAPPPRYPALPACAPTGPSPYINLIDLYGAYGDRSVEIVKASLRRDLPKLTAMVAADARISLWRGDAGYGPGGLGHAGAAGAVEFFRWFAPTGYQFVTDFAGPISGEACGRIEVRLLLTGPELSADLRFRYERGLLVEVTGRELFVSQGRLGRPND